MNRRMESVRVRARPVTGKIATLLKGYQWEPWITMHPLKHEVFAQYACLRAIIRGGAPPAPAGADNSP